VKEQDWTLIITPRRKFFSLNIRELWRYRDLIYLFVRRDFVSKFKQTILGPLWFIIQPLIATVLFTLVFGRIAKISTDGLPHILFYYSGLVAWNYFSLVFKITSKTFITNASLFSKVYFPRLTVPVANVISGLLQFAVQFIILVGFIIFYVIKGVHISIHWHILLLPYLILLMALVGLGGGVIISAMTTKYRDLTYVIDFGVQLLMYITPVIYPISQIPQKYKIFIQINPLTPIVESFRFILLGKGDFSWQSLLYATFAAIVIFIFGVAIFNRVEKIFIDTV